MTADPRMYVPRPSTERALDELTDLLQNGESTLRLAGPPGLGKTLLLHLLPERLGSAWRCAYLGYPKLTTDDLWIWIAEHLGLGQPTEEATTLVASTLAAKGGGLVLMIDDAQSMPDETLRLLAGVCAREPGLRVVLAATCEPSDQRQPGEVRLVDPLTEEETEAYLKGRLERSGMSADDHAVFAGLDMERLHDLTEGVPARIHYLATSVQRGDALPAAERASILSLLPAVIGNRLGLTPAALPETPTLAAVPKEQAAAPLDGAVGPRPDAEDEIAAPVPEAATAHDAPAPSSEMAAPPTASFREGVASSIPTEEEPAAAVQAGGARKASSREKQAAYPLPREEGAARPLATLLRRAKGAAALSPTARGSTSQDREAPSRRSGLTTMAGDREAIAAIERELEQTMARASHRPEIEELDLSAVPVDDTGPAEALQASAEAGHGAAVSAEPPIPADRTAPSSTVHGADRTAPSSTVHGADRTAPSSTVHAADRTTPSSTVHAADRTAPSSTVHAVDRTAPSSPVHAVEEAAGSVSLMAEESDVAESATPSSPVDAPIDLLWADIEAPSRLSRWRAESFLSVWGMAPVVAALLGGVLLGGAMYQLGFWGSGGDASVATGTETLEEPVELASRGGPPPAADPQERTEVEDRPLFGPEPPAGFEVAVRSREPLPEVGAAPPRAGVEPRPAPTFPSIAGTETSATPVAPVEEPEPREDLAPSLSESRAAGPSPPRATAGPEAEEVAVTPQATEAEEIAVTSGAPEPAAEFSSSTQSLESVTAEPTVTPPTVSPGAAEPTSSLRTAASGVSLLVEEPAAAPELPEEATPTPEVVQAAEPPPSLSATVSAEPSNVSDDPQPALTVAGPTPITTGSAGADAQPATDGASPLVAETEPSTQVAVNEALDVDAFLDRTDPVPPSAGLGRQVDLTDPEVIDPEPAPVVPAPPMGRLSVNARPWAEIEIDGEIIGETPLGEIELPQGRYEVIAHFPSGETTRETVTVGAKELFLVLRPRRDGNLEASSVR